MIKTSINTSIGSNCAEPFFFKAKKDLKKNSLNQFPHEKLKMDGIKMPF